MAARKFVRNPQLVDEAVSSSLEKLRKIHGDEFKASTQTILDHVDKRRIAPALPTVKNSLERLTSQGWVTMERPEGKSRGVFTFKFNGSPMAHVEVAPVAADTSQPKRRGRTKKDQTLDDTSKTIFKIDETQEQNVGTADAQALAELVLRRNNLRTQIQQKIDLLMEEIKKDEEILALVS